MRALVLALLVGSSAALANPSAFSASVGPGFLSRSFTWSDGAPASLLPTAQPFSGALAMDLSWYPGAHVTDGPGAWLGLFGQADLGLGLVSQGPSGALFGQDLARLRGGAVVRFPLGARAWLLLHGGYARQVFTTTRLSTSDGTSPRPNTPDLLVDGPRGGAGVRFLLGASSDLEVIAGWQRPFGAGEIISERFFTSGSVFAVDANVALSVGLLEHVRLRLAGQWAGTFFTLQRDPNVELSATEHYVSGTVALQWAM